MEAQCSVDRVVLHRGHRHRGRFHGAERVQRKRDTVPGDDDREHGLDQRVDALLWYSTPLRTDVREWKYEDSSHRRFVEAASSRGFGPLRGREAGIVTLLQ